MEPTTSEARWPRWQHEHVVSEAIAFHAGDSGFLYCTLCDERRPSGRMIRDEYDNLWWASLDWRGNVLERFWRGGPVRP